MLPALRASRKLVVPDLAMVPRFSISYCLVIPTPVSLTWMYFSSSLISILISRSLVSPKALGSVNATNLILSSASDALEMTYLRKISFWVYSELIRISMSLNCEKKHTWWLQWWTKMFRVLFIRRLHDPGGSVSWKRSRTVDFSSFVPKSFNKLITRIKYQPKNI